MDLGPDPTDGDDIIQRHGRRLFVLAYHLTGDGAQADDLAQECLVRGLLAPDFPSIDREAGVFLNRALVSLWKERLEHPARATALRAVGGSAPAAPARAPVEHAALWRALSRLDPTSRAVLVLRLAGDLEYETIGRVLDMAADVVYARLLQARAGLREGERTPDHALFETMNLYLDGRLPGDQRGEFERRLQSDSRLRERVEFHRGLTLELHEEAPPLPRDFARRIHDSLGRARETLALVDKVAQSAGWEHPALSAGLESLAGTPPRPAGRRLPRWPAAAVVALVFVAAATAFWIARRRPAIAPAPAAPEVSQSDLSGGPPATQDEATIEALRSLGYLAPARDLPAREPAARPPGKAATPRKTAPGAVARPSPRPAAPSPPGPAAIPPSAGPLPETAAAGAAPEPAIRATPEPATGAAPEPAVVAWRAVPVGKVPELGRDHQVIRTAVEWAALFEGNGAPSPEVAFDREMVILLRHHLGSDPPAVLAVAAVAQTAEAIVVECRREPPPAGAEAAGPPAAGQAIILPISDLPVRVVIR